MKRSLLVLAACAAAFSGCANPPFHKLWGKKWDTATPTNPAVRVSTIWEYAKGTTAKGAPARGFACRMHFFNRQGKAVEVDGDVRVYLFENNGTLKQQSKPIHQFDFTPEAWKLYFTQTSLGPGYQLFVPYPKPNPYEVTCTLQVRFRPKQGQPVFSSFGRVKLPGLAREDNGDKLEVTRTRKAGGKTISTEGHPADEDRFNERWREGQRPTNGEQVVREESNGFSIAVNKSPQRGPTRRYDSDVLRAAVAESLGPLARRQSARPTTADRYAEARDVVEDYRRRSRTERDVQQYGQSRGHVLDRRDERAASRRSPLDDDRLDPFESRPRPRLAGRTGDDRYEDTRRDDRDRRDDYDRRDERRSSVQRADYQRPAPQMDRYDTELPPEHDAHPLSTGPAGSQSRSLAPRTASNGNELSRNLEFDDRSDYEYRRRPPRR